MYGLGRMDISMEQKEYLAMFRRNLKYGKARREEICRDMESDIRSALEEGETWAEISARLGTPPEAAKEFNDAMPEAERKKRKRNRILIILLSVVVCLGLAAGGWMLYWHSLPKSLELGASGLFTQSELQQSAEQIVAKMSEEDYTGLIDAFFSEEIRTHVTPEQLSAARAQTTPEWGAFETVNNMQFYEVEQSGRHWATVIVEARYQNRVVIYTLSFDESLKLTGFFVR